MQIARDRPLHLTYCTNIHAADGWPAVRATLERFAPNLKARFSPHAPFGVGLRLSARDARELANDDNLTEFRAFLEREGLYVAIINGFPHGSFHRSVVKADVYAPDWRDDGRVGYTAQLIDILAALSPLNPQGLDAGVSTVPLSYKAWMGAAGDAGLERVTQNVVRIAAKLARLKRDRGIDMHLDVEPEPDCVIENTDETIEYFDRWLVPQGVPVLAADLGISRDAADRELRDRIRICFDCCHFSVEHENPLEALARIERSGIRIGRIQLSSALCVDMPADPQASAGVKDRLRPFADSTYLHQVITKKGAALDHYADLGEALDRAGAGDWRIHFHVPLFTSEYEGLRSSQHDVRTVIGAALRSPVTSHLEIETYTWDVLPGSLKIDLVESIAREYEWVLGTVAILSAE